MRSGTLQLAVNRVSEIGKVVDLGVASDMVEIKYSGHVVHISRSALVKLLKCGDGGSLDSGHKNNPRDNGPPNRQVIAPRSNRPDLQGAIEMDLGEHRIAESTEEFKLKCDYVKGTS